MTVTPFRTRHRANRPVAQDMTESIVHVPVDEQIQRLQAVLDDPTLSGWHDDARQAMATLTAANTLAA